MRPISSSAAAWLGSAALLAVLAGGVSADPWSRGSNWLVVRGGYAKNAGEQAGNGGAGYGFGFRHMLTPTHVNRWSVAGVHPLGFLHWTLLKDFSLTGFVDYNVLGRFGSASEIEIPATLGLDKHLRLGKTVNPYFGFGGGTFYRKSYNTGDDFRRLTVNGYVDGGFDVAVAPNQLMGIDVRLAQVDGRNVPANPVFGSGERDVLHWTVKLGYAIQY